MNKTIAKHVAKNKQTSRLHPPLKLLEEQRLTCQPKCANFPPVDEAFFEIAHHKWLQAANKKLSET